MIIKIFESIVMLTGGVTIVFLFFHLIDELEIKIKEVMKRQNKIKCLCKHEYILDCEWPSGRDLLGCSYRCRKCNKVINIDVVNESE